MSVFLSFLAVATLVIVTPGQDTALTIRNTLVGGRAAGVGTAIGVAAGQLAWAVATSVGVASLLQTSALAFDLLRFAGIVYLFYLGVRALSAALRGDIAGAERTAPGVGGTTLARALRQGIMSNLSNPKMAVFFPSLLPQFVPPENFALHALGLGALFATMTLCWLIGYAVVVARAKDFLRRPRVRRAVEATTGGVLIALGARLALSSRE